MGKLLGSFSLRSLAALTDDSVKIPWKHGLSASPSIGACSCLLVINGKENDQFIFKKKEKKHLRVYQVYFLNSDWS